MSERDVHGLRYDQAALRNCLEKINLGTCLQGSGKANLANSLKRIYTQLLFLLHVRI